jgi:hypothetical protein
MAQSKEERGHRGNSFMGSDLTPAFTNPMLTILADMNATFLEGLATAQKDWADFVQRRTREDVALDTSAPKIPLGRRHASDLFAVFADCLPAVSRPVGKGRRTQREHRPASRRNHRGQRERGSSRPPLASRLGSSHLWIVDAVGRSPSDTSVWLATPLGAELGRSPRPHTHGTGANGQATTVGSKERGCLRPQPPGGCCSRPVKRSVNRLGSGRHEKAPGRGNCRGPMERATTWGNGCRFVGGLRPTGGEPQLPN